VAEAKSGLEGLKLSVAIESQKIDSPCPDGTVAKTDPAGSTSAGSQVSIYVSTGKPPAGPGPGPGNPGTPGQR
jgi:beta-lactam-binding protein with PASTA domain